MQIRLTHVAFFFFFLTALSGVWMRVSYFTGTLEAIPYTHLLHAHSHIAVLGWTFFAVFIIFVTMIGQQNSRFVKYITVLLFLVTTIMFIAFLMQGYALYSIILSTIHIFFQYAIAYFIIKHIRKDKTIPKSSRYFIYGAVVMLVISSFGPFALGAIASQGLRDSPIFDIAIYFYLHFQYNGWLTLMLIGMFLLMLHRRKISFSEKRMQTSFTIYFISLFPGFLLSILWYNLGTIGIIFAAIGAIGQLTAIILFILTIIQANKQLEKNLSSFITYHIYGILALLAIKVAMEFGLLHPTFGKLIYETRSVVIAYLHLTLLGFISLFIITQFYLTRLLNENNGLLKFGLSVFIIGFSLNELTLFFSSLFSWLQLGTFPGQNIILLFATLCLLIAIILMWGSTLIKNTKQLYLKK